MGSAVAIDAGGSHWPRYGSTRQHVTELEIVTADGEVLRVARLFRHWLRAYDSLTGRKVHGRRLTSTHPQRALEREHIRRIRHDFGHA
jgi:GrpB-like predicted nucleotidyltransferase (UPF0157 family)